MRNREQTPNRPSREVFLEALGELRKGRIPETMPFVAAYISDSAKERGEYMDAMTECAFRLSQSNKVLREMANSLQSSLLRALGRKKDEEQPMKDFGPLILWITKKIQAEQDSQRWTDAGMLQDALDAVLLCISLGKGESNT